MSPTASMGRMLIAFGAVLVVIGVVLLLLGRLPRVPGDVVVQRPNLTVYVPIGTMIIVSLLATLILNLLSRR
jgi:uncharacterized membrane protein